MINRKKWFSPLFVVFLAVAGIFSIGSYFVTDLSNKDTYDKADAWADDWHLTSTRTGWDCTSSNKMTQIENEGNNNQWQYTVNFESGDYFSFKYNYGEKEFKPDIQGGSPSGLITKTSTNDWCPTLSRAARVTITLKVQSDGNWNALWYQEQDFTVSASTESSTKGTVSISSTSVHYKGTTTLTANAKSGYTFRGWTKGSNASFVSTSSTYTPTITENSSYTAYFSSNTGMYLYVDTTAWGIPSGKKPKIHYWDSHTDIYSDVTDPTNLTSIDGGGTYSNNQFWRFTLNPVDINSFSYLIYYGDTLGGATYKTSNQTYNGSNNGNCVTTKSTSSGVTRFGTNGTIQTITFYKHVNNSDTYISTYYLMRGEDFGLSGVSLPSTDVTGYNKPTTWHESSFNGTERAANYTYSGVTQNYTLYATYMPNGGTVIPNNKVRIWVTYYNSYNSSDKEYFDNSTNGYTIKLWIHKNASDSSAGSKVYSSSDSTVWGTYNNAQDSRRYDYFDVDLSVYTDNGYDGQPGWYLTIQRFKSDDTYKGCTQNTFKLTSTNVGKIHSINTSWNIVSESITSVDAQLASWALCGLHTCSTSPYNGFAAFNNTNNTFIKNGDSSRVVGNLSQWDIYDYYKFDTSYSGNRTYAVAADSKYDWLNYMAGNTSVMPSPSHGMADARTFTLEKDGIDFTTIIIIVASSISLLSITALSVLVIKKRKTKEE